MKYNLALSFIKTLGATATKTPSSTSYSATTSSSPVLIMQSIGFLLSIVVAIIFNRSVISKIRQKEKFSGIGWGLANGLPGIGILWVILAHNSINKEIEKVKSKKYKEYAKQQMKEFTKTYAICMVVWIVISIIVAVAG